MSSFAVQFSFFQKDPEKTLKIPPNLRKSLNISTTGTTCWDGRWQLGLEQSVAFQWYPMILMILFLRIGDDPGPRVSDAFAASWNSDVPTFPMLSLRHLRLGVLQYVSCFVYQPHCKEFQTTLLRLLRHILTFNLRWRIQDSNEIQQIFLAVLRGELVPYVFRHITLREDDLRLLHLDSMRYSLHLSLQIKSYYWTLGGHVSSVSLILSSWHILAMQFKSYNSHDLATSYGMMTLWMSTLLTICSF